MRAEVEKWYPVAVGVGAGIAYFYFVHAFPVAPDAAPSLFAAVISVAAIAVGFLMTAKSILLSIDNKSVIAGLKASGHYTTLIDYVMGATKWAFALCGVSIVCFIADLKSPTPVSWHRYLFAVWIFFIATTSASCFRVIHIFGKILRAKE